MKRADFCLLAALLTASAYGITSSLWLDEAGTWWIVKDGLREACSRALWWSATSPLYYCLAWATTQVFGLSEVALRAPSVVFSVGTAAVLYRLGQRWLDAEGAFYVVLCFFSLPAVQFSVIDARPYALGLLLLASAWLAMVRWLESGRWREGVVFAACAAGVVWAHYTLALGLVPLAWYWRRLGWRRSAAAAVGVGTLLLPLVPQFAQTLMRREGLAWLSPPDWYMFGLMVVPPCCFCLLLAAGIMTAFSRRPRTEDFEPYMAKQSLIPLLLLAAYPPVLLFLLSRIGVVQLFAWKYMLCKDMGLALLVGWAIRGLSEAGVRRATVVAAIVIAVPLNAVLFPKHGDEKWRESSEWVRADLQVHPGTQLVLVSCFIESLQPRRLDDPASREILTAPQTVYPVPGDPILLPVRANEDARRRFKESVAPAAQRAGRMVLVSLSMGPRYKTLIEEGLRGTGLRLTEERQFGGVIGQVYERR